MLLDSNIIIYAGQPEHHSLRDFIARHSPLVSVISYVEVLGYHRLSEQGKLLFEEFFANASLLPLSEVVMGQAVKLRQIRKMALGDSLIAATALTCGVQLITRNVKDFDWIAGLSILNPFED